jgi:hypothetical protein
MGVSLDDWVCIQFVRCFGPAGSLTTRGLLALVLLDDLVGDGLGDLAYESNSIEYTARPEVFERRSPM